MKTGLVLEGGACRGVFTSGVLDTMLDRGLTFDYCIGVSAGAGNAMNFRSGQRGRAFALTAGTESPVYFGFRQALESKKLLNLDLIYNRLSFEPPMPFDFGAYYANPMACEYVVTDCGTGGALYLSERAYQKRLVAIVEASSSMPGICAPVTVDGRPCLDGGIADPMPVARAMEQGCGRVVLVTTKPADNLHPTDFRKVRHVLYGLYGQRYPALCEALMTRYDRYFAQMDEILALEKAGRLFVIRPTHCEIRGLEKDHEKMRGYYRHGLEIAGAVWDDLTAYLGG